jgi:Holliday junction resolvasome RuvABC ATP-dependent DNA helicase subunit
LRGFYNQARDGVLELSELESLYADLFAVPLLATLRELMTSDPSVSVVLCGDVDAVSRLHALNPDLYLRFVHAQVRNFTLEEMGELLEDALRDRGLVPAPGFAADSVALLRRVRAVGNLRNARVVTALADAARRPSTPRNAVGIAPGDIDVSGMRLISAVGIDGFDELDALIGLSDVKSTVRLWIANSELTARREQLGLHTAGMGQHMVFKGPAGTAKTTVARIVGRILTETGVLSSGHLVEVQRADLIGEMPDQTARRMVEVVKRALGGVLFIDEAYTLTSLESTRDANRDSGREAVDTLLKLMEDYREEFVVIVAGYPMEMEGFLNSNPGLRSRFARVLEFPSYSPDELIDILTFLAGQRGYAIDAEIRPALVPRLALVSQYPGFGNGRHVRNLLESAIVRQATRVTPASSDAELRTLRLADFLDPAASSVHAAR